MKEFTGNSWIGRTTFDETTGKMRVTMHGNIYDFCNVPESVFDDFDNAKSRGTYYNENIKDKYSC